MFILDCRIRPWPLELFTNNLTELTVIYMDGTSHRAKVKVNGNQYWEDGSLLSGYLEIVTEEGKIHDLYID